jgi:nitrite reductase/ring-hydroxylating ferredoxin subunit
MGSLVVGSLLPAQAWAGTVRSLVGHATHAGERTYPVPTADGVSLDASCGVLLVRWQQQLYAFSAECPHRGANVEYVEAEQGFFCPKHEARFATDGAWLSGRRTSALDRYPLRLQDGQVVVTDDVRLEADADPAAYAAATVTLPPPVTPPTIPRSVVP